MSLEREIEQLFRRVVEFDLDKISRRAQPIFHSHSTPEPIYSFPEGGEGSIVFDELLYQVQKIELNPLRKDELKKIVDDRAHRLAFDPSTEDDRIRDVVTKPDPSDEELHEVAELYVRGTGGIGRRITLDWVDTETPQGGTTRVKEYEVINFLGVPYVRIANDQPVLGQADLAKLRVKLARASRSRLIDRWPETVVLKKLVQDQDREYRRYDLVLYPGP